MAELIIFKMNNCFYEPIEDIILSKSNVRLWE